MGDDVNNNLVIHNVNNVNNNSESDCFSIVHQSSTNAKWLNIIGKTINVIIAIILIVTTFLKS